jgi:hypothetical protein
MMADAFWACGRQTFPYLIMEGLSVNREQSQGCQEGHTSGLPTSMAKGTQMGLLLPSSETMQLQRVIFATRYCPLRRNETAANRSERTNRG